MTEKQLQQKMKEIVIVLSEKRSGIIKNFRKKLEERIISDLKKNLTKTNN